MKLKLIFLSALCCAFLCGAGAKTILAADDSPAIQERLAELEAASGGRLGVAMLDADGEVVATYRDAERFPLCSTFKMMLAAAVLKQSVTEPDLLNRRITYAQEELISWSPVTEKHVADGLSVSELCAAAVRHSDNTAANLLLKLLGGPQELTAFARSIGDPAFHLDRWETALNEALPGDERDTTTPKSMAYSLHKLALGNVLPAPQREMLIDWLKGNTTGSASIRAGVPADWIVGDKTGSGSYGTTNDIAVIWPPNEPPLILTIYFTQNKPDAPARRDIIAATAKLLVEYRLAQPRK